MKKTIILLTAILFALQMQAQDAMLLNRIREVNGKVKSFESDLANTMVKPKKTTSQNGKLYFVSPYEFSAKFTTGNYMIVNAQKIKMDIGMFHGTFKLKDGGMMQGLSRIFLYGFQGRIQDLANENGYTISTKTEGEFHIVTGTAKKKPLFGVGYKTVVFKYFTDSLLLKEIVLYDYSGNKDSYVISNVKYDIPVDKKTFQF
ncbi:MAG: hypothetical protein K6G25_07075 [Bacteroidales bacterium]|nr:hypothetical protein [Bacteroidales bacterium]